MVLFQQTGPEKLPAQLFHMQKACVIQGFANLLAVTSTCVSEEIPGWSRILEALSVPCFPADGIPSTEFRSRSRSVYLGRMQEAARRPIAVFLGDRDFGSTMFPVQLTAQKSWFSFKYKSAIQDLALSLLSITVSFLCFSFRCTSSLELTLLDCLCGGLYS